MALSVHRGWHLFANRSTNGPRYQANRHGVGLCADDLGTLKRMIDKRVADERDRAHRAWLDGGYPNGV
jgi:hypothetical protein